MTYRFDLDAPVPGHESECGAGKWRGGGLQVVDFLRTNLINAAGPAS
jgi:hypothetical protein